MVAAAARTYIHIWNFLVLRCELARLGRDRPKLDPCGGFFPRAL
jgi:hypothetical protein